MTMVNDTFVYTHISFPVGVAYFTAGVVFIFLHIICSYLIHTDKDMRNPTYQFMINLSVADILELVPLGVYAGITIIMHQEQNEIIGRFMSFVVLQAWYVNCIMFAIIAFSRWIFMTRNHASGIVFRKPILITFHVVPWAIVFLFYSLYMGIAYPLVTFYFYPDFYTWGFTYAIPLGKYLHWHNFAFNSVCAIVETAFNVMSLKWVYDTRKHIVSSEAMKSRRRETKLLIQCFIIGSVFSLASIMFTIVFAADLGGDPFWCLGMQVVWTFNHCVNPLVYLSVNSRLRQRFLAFLHIGKWKNKVGTSSAINTIPVSVGETRLRADG